MLDAFRSILAVAVGYLAMFVFVVLGDVAGYFVLDTDKPGPGYMLYLLLWNLPAGFVGGYIAAWIAGRKPMTHAGFLGGLVLAMGVAYLIGAPPIYEEAGIELPVWYLPGLPATGLVGVILGGYVFTRRRRVAG